MTRPQAMQQQLEDQRKKVDVDNYIITVRELLTMADHNELHRAPEYQRKFQWDEEAESRLIESLLLGLPVPNLFFATNPDGSWEVVDGLQRISTLIHFASDSPESLKEIGKNSPLRLEGLRKLDEFNNLVFEDLPVPVRLAFTKRGLGVTALSDKSDPQTRFDTFERLNRGAVRLSSQEVRACIYQGKFNGLLRELATSEEFVNLVKLQSRNEQNATREELVLKFFAYLNDRAKFKGAVEDFLNTYMEENRNTFDIEAGRAEFERVVRTIANLCDGKAFLRKNTNITPQNELEAVMVGAAEVLRAGGSIKKLPTGWQDDPALVAASTGATNTRGKLTQRVSRATELLSGRF